MEREATCLSSGHYTIPYDFRVEMPEFWFLFSPDLKMIKYFLFAIVIEAALGANSHGLTVDQVTALVMLDMDDNHDGHVSEGELMLELVFRWDKNFDLQVSEQEFIKFWVATYHDDSATTAAFFYNLDFNHDHHLTTDDISHHLAVLDTNGDKQVSEAEFKNFMHLLICRCLNKNLSTSGRWVEAYHDDHATTAAFFYNLDFNHDHHLTTDDISHHLGVLDQNAFTWHKFNHLWQVPLGSER
ncbi:hypothetical protein CHS0354_025399 [Potamilus streckersoni]|uniref:EF-hand domain-containing protein n=1 Tax=Potamilus streckersoni TaxID=2493646 RepID=A0AAE0SPQ6_9BIVA|nr:hypothetical protein CHS0354_025399 [Potamilus streckersoni]